MEKYVAKNSKRGPEGQSVQHILEYLKRPEQKPMDHKTQEDHKYVKTNEVRFAKNTYHADRLRIKAFSALGQKYKLDEMSQESITASMGFKKNLKVISAFLTKGKNPISIKANDEELYLNSNANVRINFRKQKYEHKMVELYKIYQFTLFRPTTICSKIRNILDKLFAFKSALRNDYIQNLLKDKSEGEILNIKFDLSMIVKNLKREIVYEQADLAKIKNSLLAGLPPLEKETTKNIVLNTHNLNILSKFTKAHSIFASRSSFLRYSKSPEVNLKTLIPRNSSKNSGALILSFEKIHDFSNILALKQQPFSESLIIQTSNALGITDSNLQLANELKKSSISARNSVMSRLAYKTINETNSRQLKRSLLKTEQSENHHKKVSFIPRSSFHESEVDVHKKPLRKTKIFFDVNLIKSKIAEHQSQKSITKFQDFSKKRPSNSLTKNKNFHDALLASEVAKGSILKSEYHIGSSSLSTSHRKQTSHGEQAYRLGPASNSKILIPISSQNINTIRKNPILESKPGFISERRESLFKNFAKNSGHAMPKIEGLYKQYTSRKANENLPDPLAQHSSSRSKAQKTNLKDSVWKRFPRQTDKQ
jgi:hypothetical protein